MSKWLCLVSELHILFQGLLEAAAAGRRAVAGRARGWRAGGAVRSTAGRVVSGSG